MNEAFAILLIGLGMAAAPEVQKRSEPIKIIGVPTLVPLQPVRIIPPLSK